VADDWQGRGVGTGLLRALTDLAREEGVRRYSALVLSDNRPMLDLLDDLREVRVKHHEAGATEVEIELPERLARALGETLRAAARGDLRVRRRRY
jgi:protein lysine acetyltransferase